MEDGADEAQQIEYQEDPQLPYEPKAPPRSQPPEVFSLWRQYMNGSMMTQVLNFLLIIKARNTLTAC